MVVALVIGIPLLALFAWAAVYDFRRRHAPRTGHDVSEAARRARGAAEGGGGVTGPGRLGSPY